MNRKKKGGIRWDTKAKEQEKQKIVGKMQARREKRQEIACKMKE